MIVRIAVTRKPGVPDAESEVMKRRLENYPMVTDVREGKCFRVDLGEIGLAEGDRLIDWMCRKLLVHPLIEEYSYEHPVGPVPKKYDDKNQCGGLHD